MGTAREGRPPPTGDARPRPSRPRRIRLLLAVTAGGVALTLALLFDPGANAWLTQGALAGLDAAFGDMAAGLPPESVLMLMAGLAKALFLLLFVPPVVVATAGEVMGRRGLLWYGGGCGLLTALLPWLVRGSPRPGSPASPPPRRA